MSNTTPAGLCKIDIDVGNFAQVFIVSLFLLFFVFQSKE